MYIFSYIYVYMGLCIYMALGLIGRDDGLLKTASI